MNRPASLLQVLLALAASITLLGSCSGDTGPHGCIPGTSSSCSCTDGRVGAQVCNSSETYDACICTGELPTGGEDAALKRIFVTSVKFDGNLGGLAGADAKCASAAAGANLPGEWRAWLSNGTTDALDRIADVGPWYLVGGLDRVFNNKANLTTTPLAPITRNQNGESRGWGSADVWTGTRAGGTRGVQTCQNWTSATFQDTGLTGTSASDTDWTEDLNGACNAPRSLYCLQQ
jgi:hypothetical protein